MKASARRVSPRVSAGSGEATIEVRLPALPWRKRLPEGRSVAVLDVSWPVMSMRVVGRVAVDAPPPPALTEAEAEALASGGSGRPFPDAVVAAAALAAAAYDEIVEAALSVDDAAERLGVNPSRVRQRLGEGSLYGIKHAGAWRLPSFQFTKRGLVRGIDVVLRALPADLSALAVVRWFETPNPDLCTRDDDERALTPLEWLAAGHPADAAAELANAL
jgi:hypothetical protein